MTAVAEESFDIEDIVPRDDTQRTGVAYQSKIVPRVRRRKQEQQERMGYNIPGTQTIYMKTYGCSHNVSDGEYMAGLLADYGYNITENFDVADAYLINSCTVKNPSQDSFVNLIRKVQAKSKPVIVAGCVPQGDPKHSDWSSLSVVGTQQIERVVEVVEESLKGHTVRLLGRSKQGKPSLDMPKIRKNPFIEIIPINLGCLNACTYCKTKHARGNLNSYPVAEVLARAKTVLEEGVKELRITSEDTGAYGRDIGTDIVQLLKPLGKLVGEYPGAMLRVGMTNPPYILEHLEGIAEVLNMPNVYAFLHIPVQAGSNRVLDAMKREYTCEEFQHVVDVLRELVPGITLATDIICGFPGETDEEFAETMALCEKNKFPILNISQFYPRPGTPAASMKRTPTSVVKERSRQITRLFESYATFEPLIGTRQKVWVTEVAADGYHMCGHTKGYVQVLLDPKECAMGAMVECEIISATKFSVVGKVVVPGDAPVEPPRHSTRVTEEPEEVPGTTSDVTQPEASAEISDSGVAEVKSTSTAEAAVLPTTQSSSSSGALSSLLSFAGVVIVIWLVLLLVTQGFR